MRITFTGEPAALGNRVWWMTWEDLRRSCEWGAARNCWPAVPLVASDVGQVTFSADPADVLPAHELGLYDADRAVAASAIEFSNTVLDIIDGFQNTREFTDTNSDGTTSPIDALLVINFLNAYGAQPVEDFRSLATRAGESEPGDRSQGVTHYYYDINGDRHVTPLDVLLVVNRLNNAVLSTAGGEGEASSSSLPTAAPMSGVLAAEAALEPQRLDSGAGRPASRPRLVDHRRPRLGRAAFTSHSSHAARLAIATPGHCRAAADMRPLPGRPRCSQGWDCCSNAGIDVASFSLPR